MTGWRVALVALCVAAGACERTTVVGSLACMASADCAPPSTICGPDARCVMGCGDHPASCIGGASCEPTSGECAGSGLLGVACSDDHGCDPPDVVCSLTTSTCVAGCTATGLCAAGEACEASTGHCCDQDKPGCVAEDPLGRCDEDSDCMGAPALVCVDHACVSGCGAGGSCLVSLTCDPATGHCVPAGCGRDLDCDPLSYCTPAGTCAVLPHAGASKCAGGTPLSYHCATEETAAGLTSCAAPGGTAGCPYCIDSSCVTPGQCATANDCHRGSSCEAGLCRGSAPQCASITSVSQVVSGAFGAGKQVCVHAQVASVKSGYDGLIEIKLGPSPVLFVDVFPMYQKTGLVIPTPGQMVTVHGTVRWDANHADWELLPVDWIGP